MTAFRADLSIHAAVDARVARRLSALAAYGVLPPPPARVLDLGCGGGDTVSALLRRGYDAYGCDLRFREGLDLQTLQGEDRLRIIQLEPYRLPFDDASFDLVISDQVFEHVQDYPATIAELARVTRPGGLGLHVFPPPWRPVEVHLGVPLAGAIGARPWLWLWALLGVRNVHQRGLGARETVEVNANYLARNTNYLSRARIRREFLAYFASFEGLEREFLASSPRRRSLVGLAGVGSAVARLYGSVGMRVVLVRRAPADRAAGE